MGKVNIFVSYNLNGEIVAIGRSMAGSKVFPLAGDRHFVLETEVDEESIKGMHRTHLVDVNKKAIVRRPASK